MKLEDLKWEAAGSILSFFEVQGASVSIYRYLHLAPHLNN